jgi:hypothetical protein
MAHLECSLGFVARFSLRANPPSRTFRLFEMLRKLLTLVFIRTGLTEEVCL